MGLCLQQIVLFFIYLVLVLVCVCDKVISCLCIFLNYCNRCLDDWSQYSTMLKALAICSGDGLAQCLY